MSNSSDPIIGIDLGTTFSLVAIADEQGPRLLRDETGEARLPSVLGVRTKKSGTHEFSIGWDARNHAVENARSTVYSIKRLIGKSMEEIAEELPFLTYAVGAGPRDTLRVNIDGRLFSPEEISSLILRTLRERAETQLGCAVSKAVITVPAYFDDAQRQATRNAAQVAGLEVVRMINEPTAAALAYGVGLRNPKSGGQGNADTGKKSKTRVPLPMPHCKDEFEVHSDKTPLPPRNSQSPRAANNASIVAVYDLGGGTFDFSILRIEGDIFQVISTAGDTRLGGDDFDRAIAEHIRGAVREEYGIDIESPASRQALRGLAEATKIRLSSNEAAQIELALGENRAFGRTMTRDDFQALIAPLVARTLERCDAALADAKLTTSDIDRVILVGGSTRVPLVRSEVERHFGKPPYTALNPDEVVALGAAVQASIINGQTSDMLLLDVIPLSLGLETMGGAVGKLIMRNAAIPCRATEMFTTFVDGQTAIKLNVLQGERELAEHCRSLAEFELRGLPAMPAGIPKVEVEFLVDANGILNVAATEQRSGVSAQVQVVPNYGLTADEVSRMTADSIRFAEHDVEQHRKIDLMNQVAFDTQKTEQMLDNLRDELSDEEQKSYKTAIRKLREFANTTTDLDALYRALHEFGRKTLPLAERGIRAALTAKSK